MVVSGRARLAGQSAVSWQLPASPLLAALCTRCPASQLTQAMIVGSSLYTRPLMVLTRVASVCTQAWKVALMAGSVKKARLSVAPAHFRYSGTPPVGVQLEVKARISCGRAGEGSGHPRRQHTVSQQRRRAL